MICTVLGTLKGFIDAQDITFHDIETLKFGNGLAAYVMFCNFRMQQLTWRAILGRVEGVC